jgi:hypothetical protein
MHIAVMANYANDVGQITGAKRPNANGSPKIVQPSGVEALTAPGSLPQSEEGQERDDNYDGTNDIDDIVHERFLRVEGGFESRSTRPDTLTLPAIIAHSFRIVCAPPHRLSLEASPTYGRASLIGSPAN